jgi:hypothetical protein
MDSIKFVPQSQKNIEQLEGFKSINKGDRLIYILISFFVIYSAVVGGGYWFFVVQEQNRVFKAIKDLDSTNSQYYINNDLEQGLFNIVDLIEGYYNPITAMKEIESAYVSGARISGFSYNKTSKIVNISMTVSSINDVTKQIDNFNKLQTVASSSYSAVSSDTNDVGFSFGVEIILK